MIETKECTRCRQTLPLTAFAPRYKDNPNYVHSLCRLCNTASVKEWRATHPSPNAYAKTLLEYFYRHVTPENPQVCWEWKGSRLEKGYGEAMFKRKRYGGHQVAYILFHGELSGNDYVCHTCDNPPCCNPHHLYLGNAQTNTDDAFLRERRGKYTKEQVQEIRRLREDVGMSYHTIATHLAIPYTTAYLIGSRKTWKHIK